jgi:hypothetical protein
MVCVRPQNESKNHRRDCANRHERFARRFARFDVPFSLSFPSFVVVCF